MSVLGTHRAQVIGRSGPCNKLVAVTSLQVDKAFLRCAELNRGNPLWFNGATTVTLGDVALPIKAEPVTQQILFSVVEDFGPYNIIMGWALLHSIKVIPSAYHQTVSYLTNVGQVDLLSSQLVARQCY